LNVQEVSWDKGGTVRAGNYDFFPWKRKRKSSMGKGFFVHHRIVSAVRREEFVSDRMSYRVWRGRWCNFIVLNVQVTSEEKSDGSKDSFMKKLEQIFDHFSKYYTKFLLVDFNTM
jgi:hypothetical protein